ncbi:nucleoside transporter [Mollisia scopiformis]
MESNSTIMTKGRVVMTKIKAGHQDEEQISVHEGVVDGATRGRGELEVMEMRQRISILRKLNAAEAWLDKGFGIETTGADRLPEDQRQPPSIFNMIFLWFSMNMTPGLITMGLLGPIFGLSVNVSIVISVFGTAIGAIIPSFTATLCAATGLRQIAVSRYAFGIWGAKFCGLLNILINIGFGTIDCIVAGQLISAVSGGKVTIAVGIVILCVVSFMISLLGFRLIHRYEQVAWILILVLLCVEFGQSAKYFSPTPQLSSSSGKAKIGAALNYFALVFGQVAGWCSLSGDYYVHYPADINKWLVFWLTWVGLVIPTVFVLILGNQYGGIILTNPTLSTIYDDGGIGALILATLSPSGWGKFVCVMYALSFVAGVTAIYYSSSLSIQLWAKHFMAVPRFVWNTVLAAISLALAWGGREHLSSVIVDFLSLLGYWTICFGTILAFENFWFRPRNGGYDLEGWQDQDGMPLGIAGCSSLAVGLGVSFLGMDQTWFIGPAARAIGPEGGDLGNYITLMAVVLTYPPLRLLEIKFTKR